MGGDSSYILPILGELPSTWAIDKFGDVLVGGTRNGVYKPKQFHGRGVKIVNMGELFANPRLYSIPMKRIELTSSEKAKFLIESGDLLFARRSLVAEGAGKCCLVCEVTEDTTFESSLIRARPDLKRVDSTFVFYLFSSPYGKYLLQSILRQVAVSGITGSDLVDLEIPVPPLPEQRNIACVLRTLDDKIELNRKMNQTLEEMARAIFKSWFMDFDPVHAKANGKKPNGIDSATAALFPSEFEDSKLGKIPKGWSLKRVEDIVNVTDYVANGSFESLKKNVHTSDEEGFAVLIRLVDFNRGWSGPLKYVDQQSYDFLSKSSIEPAEVIISNVGANAGTVFRAPNFGRPMTLGPNAVVLKPDSLKTSSSFLYFYFTGEYGQSQLQSITGGSAQPKFNKTDLRNLSILVPSSSVHSKFNKLINSMHSKIEATCTESSMLTEIRDALLPKLLSGDIRIKDAEKTVGVAV